ncbi:MAG: exodeoxyribonuclease VII small subunit [Patescibacteria group bacterium]|nr:exodeoxyribonuclease VII small subunit [Patescibacteria group bacterium]
MAENKKIKISESLGKLEEIVDWFEKQEDVDVEEGLKKVKEGAAIIKALKTRLKEVETEFSEIRRELEG